MFLGAAGTVPGTLTIVTDRVPVRPPYVAVTVTVRFDVTADAVSTPPEPIVAYDEFSLHAGLTAAVVPLSHVPVAVYVPVPPSFTDEGPLTVTEVSTGGGGAPAGTTHGNAGESDDSSPVSRTAFAVK